MTSNITALSKTLRGCHSQDKIMDSEMSLLASENCTAYTNMDRSQAKTVTYLCRKCSASFPVFRKCFTTVPDSPTLVGMSDCCMQCPSLGEVTHVPENKVMTKPAGFSQGLCRVSKWRPLQP